MPLTCSSKLCLCYVLYHMCISCRVHIYVHISCSISVHILCSFIIHSPITFPLTDIDIQYTVVTREVRSSRHIRMMIQSTRIRSLSKLSSQFDQVLNRIYPLPLSRSLKHLPLHVVMRSLVMKSNQH